MGRGSLFCAAFFFLYLLRSFDTEIMVSNCAFIRRIFSLLANVSPRQRRNSKKTCWDDVVGGIAVNALEIVLWGDIYEAIFA
jgi:hypothetical protein